jgi:hypothetical protein
MMLRNFLVKGWLLNLLIPGLGHIFVREYSFGLFIYLVTLIGVVLFAASFFIELSGWALLLLFGLPVTFYAFTFVDLARTVRARQTTIARSRRGWYWFLVIGLAYQLLAPTAVVNLAWRNRPEVFLHDTPRLSPRYAVGTWLKASPLAYRLEIATVSKPIMHDLPDRYDLVRFETSDGERAVGAVLGLPGEQVEIISGVVVVNGLTDYNAAPLGTPLAGDCPLTRVGEFSILVAIFNIGRVEQVLEVPLGRVTGKISELL